MNGRRGSAPQRGLRQRLKHGGLIAYATASCFGLGCDPRNVRGLTALLRLKRRPKSKGLIVIADHFAQLVPFVRVTSSEDLAPVVACWPGPHTWLLPASRRASRLLRGRHELVAVRVDAHPDAVAACRAVGGALVSTSLNITGRRPVTRLRDALRQFGRRVLVLPGRIGADRRPSTIHDFTTGRILRS